MTDTLNSTPNGSFTVQVFRNNAAVGPDPSSHGEGETFVGSAPVKTDANGNGSFEITDTGGSTDATYTATATNGTTNDTSEFSAAVEFQEKANTAPTVTLSASNPTTVDEGQTTRTYSFSIDDPDTGDTFTYKSGFPDCGTGGALVGTPSITGAGGSFQCRFPDGPASPNVMVSGFDSDNASSNTATQDVRVDNVAPRISSVTNDGPVDEGSPARITVAVDDPGDDTFLYSFDCNDDGDYGDANVHTGPQRSGSANCSFDDDRAGPYTVNVRAADGDQGGSTTGSTTVTVRNVPPTATFDVPDAPVDEGSGFDISLTGANDPSSADRQAGFTYDFDCGSGYDGTFDSTSPATCPTTGDGEVTVKGKVRDTDGGVAEYTGTVAVRNVAPAVKFSKQNPTTADEGETKTYAFTVVDPGEDTQEITFDCGMNGEEVGPVVYDEATGEGSFECRFPDGPSSTTVGVTTDDGKASDSTTVTVEVANLKPSVSISGPEAADEGQTRPYAYAVTDPGPGDDGVEVATGCGANGVKVEGSDEYNPATGKGGFRCSFPDGPATTEVSATATDKDGAVDADGQRVAVTVDNVAPTVELTGENAADEGQTKDYAYTISDPGDDPGPTITEDCGENGVEVDTPEANGFRCSFLDGPAGSTVSVAVNDGAATGSDSIAVEVSNADPKVELTGDAADDEGQKKTYTYTVTDPGQDAPAVDESCGDGAEYEDTAAENSFVCSFPNGPVSTDISVSVDDGDPGSKPASGSMTVEVANVNPTVVLTGEATAGEGETKEYRYRIADPGRDDTHARTTGCGAKGREEQGSDAYDAAKREGSFRCYFPDSPATTDVTVAVTDSDGASDTDDQRVAVAIANTAPAPGGQETVTVAEDGSARVTLAGSDVDDLSFEVVRGPARGTLGAIGPVTCEGTARKSCKADVTYTPQRNFNGSDSFAYRACDGAGSCSAPVEVRVAVGAVNDAPTARANSYRATEDRKLDVRKRGVLANDADVDGDRLTARVVKKPRHGRLTLRSNGSFSYTPNKNYAGRDTFVYEVRDGSGGTARATVTLSVRNVPEAKPGGSRGGGPGSGGVSQSTNVG